MKFKKIITLVVTICLLSILLAIPAFATVTESDGDGYVLYNGVKLPNIDTVWTEQVKETYPYCFVCVIDEVTFVYMSNVRFYCVDDFGSYQPTADSGNALEYDLIDGELVFYGDLPINASTTFSTNEVVWSSYDVLGPDNSVFLAASDPVPLDGMNVIEWDGDTTGLTSYEFNDMSYYELTDYANASSACAVVKEGGYIIYIPDFVASDGEWYCTSGFAPVCISTDTRNSISSAYIYFNDSPPSYCSLIAYRPGIESPPGEGGGGGDDPEDPQPPCGVARYNYYR